MIRGRQSVFVFVGAVVYSSLFIGILLVFLPNQVVTRSGLTPPPHLGPEQWVGLLLTIAGGIMGYVRAGSTASIIAGSISGILLLLAAFTLRALRVTNFADGQTAQPVCRPRRSSPACALA